MYWTSQLPWVLKQANVVVAVHSIYRYDLCEEINDDHTDWVAPMDAKYVEKVENGVKTWVQD